MDSGREERTKESGVDGQRKRIVSVLYTNCQSLNNKRDELKACVGESEPDIICLTECWTNELIDSSILKLSGYEMTVRKDRMDTAGGRGGGVIIYVKEGIPAWEIDCDTDFCQVAGIEIKGDKGVATSIYCVYRSPNSSQLNDEKLLEWMRRREGRYVMCGDFNYPGIKWDEGRSDVKGRDFLEVIQSKFM